MELSSLPWPMLASSTLPPTNPFLPSSQEIATSRPGIIATSQSCKACSDVSHMFLGPFSRARRGKAGRTGHRGRLDPFADSCTTTHEASPTQCDADIRPAKRPRPTDCAMAVESPRPPVSPLAVGLQATTPGCAPHYSRTPRATASPPAYRSQASDQPRDRYATVSICLASPLDT